MEKWKDIKGFEGLYQVSNLGNVRSLDRLVKHKGNNLQIKEGRLLIPQPTKFNYLRFDLSGKKRRAHRLVAEAFIPNPNNKSEVNHLNGINNDNRIENLEWCTRIENMKHSYKTGLWNNQYTISKLGMSKN